MTPRAYIRSTLQAVATMVATAFVFHSVRLDAPPLHSRASFLRPTLYARWLASFMLGVIRNTLVVGISHQACRQAGYLRSADLLRLLPPASLPSPAHRYTLQSRRTTL